jgi:hypothetical protein
MIATAAVFEALAKCAHDTGIAGCWARRERPYSRRAAEQRDEFATFRSITSSARSR